jgi:solute carrier family 30 (zinc transporter), member 5/7
VEVLAGFANSVLLLFVALNIVLESVQHYVEGEEVSTHRLLPVSVVGLVVNFFGLLVAHEAHHHAPAHPSEGQQKEVPTGGMLYLLSLQP